MAATEEKYKDIIDRRWDENPEFFLKYPRMSLENRAKIFAPFAALRGHGDRLMDEQIKTQRTQRIYLPEEELDVLSGKLTQARKGMDVTITYFVLDDPDRDIGYYREISGTIREIDPLRRVIQIDTGEMSEKSGLIRTLPLDDLLDIRGEEIVDTSDFWM